MNSKRTSQLAFALRSGGAKTLVLPINAILSLLTMRLIIEHYGTQSYAEYGLLLSMGALLPFADLGISAAVVNIAASSKSPSTDLHLQRVATTALRYLILVGAVLVCIDILIFGLNLWPIILGGGLSDETGSLAAFICLAIFAFSLPFGIGQRMLVGIDKNHLQIYIQLAQYPLILGIVYILVLTDTKANAVLAAVSYAAVGAVAVATFVIAGKLTRPLLWRAVRSIPRFRSFPNAKIFDIAWPMLVQMIAIPAVTQSGRIILSQVSTVEQLAQYNLASQLFMPVWQVTGAAGVALWPHFARARAAGKSTSPLPLAWIFLAIVALMTTIVSLLAPWLSAIISNGAIVLDVRLCIAYSMFVSLNAFLYPIGMFMTDSRGLRFQAYCAAFQMPIGVGLSLILADELGASGPVLACFAGMFFAQVIPNLFYIRSSLSRLGEAENADLEPVN